MDIEQLLYSIGNTIFIVVFLSIIFFLLAYLLSRRICVLPGQSINFVAVDPPRLINEDSKCEYWYPIINLLFANPAKAFSVAILYSYMPMLLDYQILNDTISTWPLLLQIIFSLFTIDFALYVRHRISHEYFWFFHAIHHCAHKVSWLTAGRVHPFDTIIMGILNAFILYIIGINGEAFTISATIYIYWNYFVHSNICLDWPKPLKYIFGSPNFHRWHHAQEKEAHNTNYAIVFSCIDYIFGTFYLPDNRLPMKYGASSKILDDHENTNILRELWYPFQAYYKKFKKYIP